MTTLMRRVTRRPSGPCDLAVLRQLFAESRADLLLLPADTRDVMLEMQFRAQRGACIEQHPDARRELLLLDGEVVGHLVTEIRPSHPTQAIVLLELMVRGTSRGEDIAETVLAELQHEATVTGRTFEIDPLRGGAHGSCAQAFETTQALGTTHDLGTTQPFGTTPSR